MTSSTSRIQPRFIVEATIIRACSLCGGKMVDDEGQAVSECPKCHVSPQIENLGIIHDNWAHKTNGFINRMKKLLFLGD